MRRKYLFGAALALGLTASAMAQAPPTPPPTPTTGGTAPKGPATPPGTPTTGGTAPKGPTAPPGTPTTGGTAPGTLPSAPPGTPTTGGTAPGTIPKAPPGTPTTGGTVPGTAPPTTGTTGTAGTAIAPPNTSPFPPPLFQQTDIARSLGLNDRQTAELTRLDQTLRTRFASDFQGIARLPAADQIARRQELERQFRQDFLTASRDIFDARQLNRFQQIQAQFGGFSTLADPVVQRQLGLTDAQIRDLQASIDWSTGQLRESNTVSATDRERAARLYADYPRAFSDRFNRFLTPEQQRSWATLTGERFNFPPMFPTGLPGVTSPGTTTPGTGVTPAGGTTTPPKQ
jgi:hypothetical protein